MLYRFLERHAFSEVTLVPRYSAAAFCVISGLGNCISNMCFLLCDITHKHLLVVRIIAVYFVVRAIIAFMKLLFFLEGERMKKAATEAACVLFGWVMIRTCLHR